MESWTDTFGVFLNEKRIPLMPERDSIHKGIQNQHDYSICKSLSKNIWKMVFPA